ncbi:MAG TPA: hypothetical protein VLI69_01905 [Gammaproteobacteria bacterium]|nr:hypothetical protein [Gammaproteobacteria bacterium]
MIFDLTELGLLRISGEQAKKFLQGQLTCNLDDITSSQFRPGAHCNPQGRVISLFQLFMYDNDYYLQMPRELIPVAMQALQKYAVFFKVKLNDASQTLKQLGYAGDELPDMPKNIHEQLSLDQFIVMRLPGAPVRYQFIGKIDAMNSLQSEQKKDFNAWKSMDILHKIASIYPETSEKFLPHELDLPHLNAVSFNKGCYTGQEIIARMEYRGKLKNHLYLRKIHTEATLKRGSEIYSDGKSSGNLVDFCEIDDNVYELYVFSGSPK